MDCIGRDFFINTNSGNVMRDRKKDSNTPCDTNYPTDSFK